MTEIELAEIKRRLHQGMACGADERALLAYIDELMQLIGVADEWLKLSTEEEPMQNIMSDAAIAREVYRLKRVVARKKLEGRG